MGETVPFQDRDYGWQGMMAGPEYRRCSCMATNPEINPLITSFPPSGTQSLPTRKIRVIGVPLDMGASRRGVNLAGG